jgi:uncharacterized repeat protein (TIGR01451 family)
LVTNGAGEAQADVPVTVTDAGGVEAAAEVTNDDGFALFSAIEEGSYTVSAETTISGITFRATGGVQVRAGETAFLQLVLRRDFDQTVFPNIDGESVTLGAGSDIALVPVPGGDSNPEIDCNIIRTQHMFIAEVRNEDGDLVSGAKVEWNLNISENGTISLECPEILFALFGDEAGCTLPTVPGNTGSIVDSDDPDLNPNTARSGLSSSFTVDSRRAVTFTNDNAQMISFGSSGVTVGRGQSWIIITSPVEGITDLIVSSPDIPISDGDCALNDPDECDKEFAIKRWVNWNTMIWELDYWDESGFDVDWDTGTNEALPDPDITGVPAFSDLVEVGPTHDLFDALSDGFAHVTKLTDGDLITHVLDRREPMEGVLHGDPNTGNKYELGCETYDGNIDPLHNDGDGDDEESLFGDVEADENAEVCELTANREAFVATIMRLRGDSPFNISRGFVRFGIEDDSPDLDFWGENLDNGLLPLSIPLSNGCQRGYCNVETNGVTDDQYWIGDGGPGSDIDDAAADHRNAAWGEFDANNDIGDGGLVFEDDFYGWVVAEARLDPSVYYCVDDEGSAWDGPDGCTPGAIDAEGDPSGDYFSDAYLDLLAGNVDNRNTISVTIYDEFGEICGEFEFTKEWVTSRLTLVKFTAGQARIFLNDKPTDDSNDGKNVDGHTIQVGQTFSYTITAINDGDVRAENVRITDTLPRFGDQFAMPDPGSSAMRNGSTAFVYKTDRPAFDPDAIFYGIDEGDDESGNDIDHCVRGDQGGASNAIVEPMPCMSVSIEDEGTISGARSHAEQDASLDDDSDSLTGTDDAVIWIQWFDFEILARTAVGGGIQSEDSVEVTLFADPTLYSSSDLPGTWCNIATVIDGPWTAMTDKEPESFAADTLCHEVTESLLDVRKTADDAIIQALTDASWVVEIKNDGSATLTNVVVHDTLDSSLFDGGTVSCDDHVDVTVSEVGAVTCSETGDYSFAVTIGDLAPTDWKDVYRVEVPTPSVAGVFCNRITATGENPAGTLTEQDISCIQTTVALELDIEKEDGFLDAQDVFSSAKEIFTVGESGDQFAYRIVVTNQSLSFTATGVSVVDTASPNVDIFDLDVNSCADESGAVPNGANGFTWTIGSMPPQTVEVLTCTATAKRAGDDVNRVELFADQITVPVTNEETTTITD